MHSVAHANWVAHVNGVNPPPELRHWLVDTTSLTVKLVTRSAQFRVQRIKQGFGLILSDEYAAAHLPRRIRIREREVVLRCDERPVVYGHTIVPATSNASDWPFFNALGERSLGSTLFGDPAVRRGALQFARLGVRHPLMRRACSAIGRESFPGSLYARRCLFKRKNGSLLVTELFLPAIVEITTSAKPCVNIDLKSLSAVNEALPREATI